MSCRERGKNRERGKGTVEKEPYRPPTSTTTIYREYKTSEYLMRVKLDHNPFTHSS